jgi:hypothetical protein
MRLVAPAVPAQVDGHDAMTPTREVLELGREVRVVATPPVDQQDGWLPFAGFFVNQSHPVAP